MKIAAMFLLALALFCGYAHAQAPGQLENIDVDSLLKNGRYVRTQIQCVLNQGKCDKTGRDLKDLLPEVLQRNCAKCSAVQRTNSSKIVNFMKQNHPSDWVQINGIYGRK